MATVDTEVEPVDMAEDANRSTNEEGKEAKGKRKFKPLEKMRRFFKSSKKSKSKESGSVSGKAKSTGALNQESAQSEDDDDGGFRLSLPMGGTRSISEDSVFKPDPKDTSLREKTVSMEAVSSGFQRELFSKLRHRHLSRSDEDDGLGQSPVQHDLSMSDLFMGGGLKPLPSAGKSTSRESDNSLISLGSDHDEDFFKSDWQSAVASVKKPRSSASSQSDSSMDQNLDFGVVLRNTQPLSTDAAKHRISIKPKSRRNTIATSRRNREVSSSTPPLPSLNEESPTKPTADKPLAATPTLSSPTEKVLAKPTVEKPIITTHDNKTSIQVKEEISPPKKTESSTVKAEDKSLPVSAKDKVEIKSVKHDIDTLATKEKDNAKPAASLKPPEERKFPLSRQRPKSLMVESGARFSSSTEEKESGSEFSQAFNKIKRLSLKREITPSELAAFSKEEKGAKEIDIKQKPEPLKEVDILNKQDSNQNSVSVNKSPVSKQDSLPKNEQKSVSNTENKSPVSPVKKSPISPIPSSNVTYVLKKEPLRSPPSVSSSDYENVQLKSQKSPISSPEHDYDNVPADLSRSFKSKVTDKESPPDKHVPTDTKSEKTSPNKLPTPNEEYRLKRQARSKTLPNQPVPREILDAKPSNVSSTTSVRNRTESYKESKPSAVSSLSRSFTASKTDNMAGKETPSKEGVEAVGKKVEPKRLSWIGSSSSVESNVSSQPSWISMAKKKHESNEEKTKSEQKVQSDGKTKVEQKETSKPPISGVTTKESDKVGSATAKNEQPKAVTTTSSKDEKEKINGNKKFPETKTETAQKPPLRAKPTDLPKSTAQAKKSPFENSPASSTPIPSWKANLSQKKSKDPQVKIEIIEKSEPKKPDNQNVTPKPEEKKTNIQLRNKPVTEKCADVAKSNTKSSVLDMVKSFQKLQAT